MEDNFIKDVWNDQAKKHEGSPTASWGDIHGLRLEHNLLSSYINDGNNVLDVGCANGFASIKHAEEKEITIYGIDYSPEMIKYANKNKKVSQRESNINFGIGDITNIEFDANSFDVVYTTIEIPKNILTARLVTKAYNDALIKYQESELFIGGVWADAGFRQKPILTNKSSKSETTYTLRKKISLLVTSITSFSSKPLVYIFNIGLFTTFVSLLFILKLLFNKLFYGVAFEGWTSLIVSVWFFGGLIILMLGIIGIYLSKIFIETKNRPYTIVRKYYER